MTTGSIDRLKLPQPGHWKSSHVSRTTFAVGDPRVRPERGMAAGIGLAGGVTGAVVAPTTAPLAPGPAEPGTS